MNEVKTYGKLVSGKPLFYRLGEFWEKVSYMHDGRIELIVKRSYKKRSLPQNDYYWAVIIDCFCSGYHNTSGEICDKQEAHEFLKHRFCSKEIVNPDTGESDKIPQSTTRLTTVEMEEYHDRCREFIHEWFGVTVPLPNEKME